MLSLTLRLTSILPSIAGGLGFINYKSTPAIGRKVLYRKADGTASHSAVVAMINPFNNTVYVISKWHAYGLFYHELTDCPYYQNAPYIYYYELNPNI